MSVLSRSTTHQVSSCAKNKYGMLRERGTLQPASPSAHAFQPVLSKMHFVHLTTYQLGNFLRIA